ncbi:MAG: DUF5678 domain-containing protein [Candidatus Thermoplasmatota archaeon]
MEKKDDFINELSGEWVLLLNDEIVDHSNDVEDILKLAEKKYPEEKYPNDEIKISKVLTEDVRLI